MKATTGVEEYENILLGGRASEKFWHRSLCEKRNMEAMGEGMPLIEWEGGWGCRYKIARKKPYEEGSRRGERTAAERGEVESINQSISWSVSGC